MRKLTILFAFLGLSYIAITAGVAKNTAPEFKAAVNVSQQSHPPVNVPAGTIDGAEHPELIPDHIAYLVIFRMIADRHSEPEINSIRAYLRQMMGLGKQKNCQGCRPSTGDGDADIDALLAAAEEFHQRVSVLDKQVAAIKDQTWPNPSPEVLTQLTQLQAQKEALVAETVDSLPHRLSVGGLERVRAHINRYVKQNIKLTPGPATPPNGLGWQHPPEHQH